MALKKPKTLNTSGPLSRIQDNLVTAINAITDQEILDGIRLTNISLITGSVNKIDHKLGRAPLGWIVTRKRSNADVWDVQDSNLLPSKTLNLNCSADVIVDLWIF